MATGIPIDDLVKLPFSFENNCTASVFPAVFANGGTYKVSIDQIFYDNSISNPALQDNVVTTSKIADNSITTSKILDLNIVTSKIQNNAVTSDKLNSVTGSEAVIADVIRNEAIITSKIKDNAVTNAKIADNSINTLKLENNSITTSKITDEAITTSKIDNQAITNEKITDNTITSLKLVNFNNNLENRSGNLLINSSSTFNSVSMKGDATIDSAGNLTLKTIARDKIEDNIIDSSKLEDNSVTESKIVNSNVTSSKIADNAVTSAKIVDRSITNDKIEDLSVDEGKISSSAVTNSKIKDQSITPGKIQDFSIGAQQIQEGGVTSFSLGLDSVVTDKVKDSNVTREKIANNAIDNNKIDSSDNYTFNSINNTTANIGINNIQYEFPSTLTNDRFLKHTSGGCLEWVTPTEFSPRAPSTVLDKVLPIGSILPFAKGSLPADGKFLPCDGSERNDADFPELSQLIKGIYGTASSASKFKLPDLTSRVPVGYSTADSNFNSVGKKGGSNDIIFNGNTEGHTLTVDEMPRHSHCLCGNDRGTNSGQLCAPGLFKDGAEKIASDPNSIQQTGGNQSHCHGIDINLPDSNIQKYNTVYYIIKAIPDRVVQLDVDLGQGLVAKGTEGDPNAITSCITLNSSCLGLDLDTNRICISNKNKITIANNAVTFSRLHPDAVITESEGIPSNDNDTTLPTSAAVKNYVDTTAIGVNQKWSQLTNNISDVPFAADWTSHSGTTFTNNSDKPIEVHVWAYANALDHTRIYIQFDPGGLDEYELIIATNTNSGGGQETTGSIMVPAGTSYRFRNYDPSAPQAVVSGVKISILS